MPPRRFGAYPGLSLQDAIKDAEDKEAARAAAARRAAADRGPRGGPDSAYAKAAHPMLASSSATPAFSNIGVPVYSGMPGSDVRHGARLSSQSGSSCSLLSPMSSLSSSSTVGAYVYRGSAASTIPTCPPAAPSTASCSGILVRPSSPIHSSKSAAIKGKASGRKGLPEVYDKVR